MVYSHIWDLLLKVALIIGLVVLSQSLHAEEWLRGIGVPAGYSVPTLVAIITVAWIAISREVLCSILGEVKNALRLESDLEAPAGPHVAPLRRSSSLGRCRSGTSQGFHGPCGDRRVAHPSLRLRRQSGLDQLVEDGLPLVSAGESQAGWPVSE